jgi:hypothetical protein
MRVEWGEEDKISSRDTVCEKEVGTMSGDKTVWAYLHISPRDLSRPSLASLYSPCLHLSIPVDSSVPLE